MKYILGLLLFISSEVAFAQDGFSRPDVPGNLMVDIGFNYLNEEPTTIDQSGFRSKSVGIYYTKRKAIGNKFSCYYGLGLGLEKLSLGDTTTLQSGVVLLGSGNTDSLASVYIADIPAGLSYDKNRLAITYLEIPLDIRFHPKETQDGEGLFIGVGGVLGLRLNSHTKFKYEEGDETVIEKIQGDYNLSAFRYGVQVRFGFKGIHLFYKQYFSDVFQDPLGGANPRMTTIGINVTGF
ncbi:MAG: outer membrane beta-barrel protein [Bacteroidota bacterium]